ncbi:hypothetical protein Efla_002790 [Eimeria flavescens]
MGVKGLWEAVRRRQQTIQIELKTFAGKRVAIDIAGWLYKAVWRFALEFLLEHQGPSLDSEAETPQQLTSSRLCLYRTAWLSAVACRLEAVRAAGVEPLCVFDGAPLKAKEEANQRRRRAAAAFAAAALLQHSEGKLGSSKQTARKGLSVPEAFKLFVQEELRKQQIAFLVAPYEADAQIARLVADGLAAAAISEDGDLLAYGCRQVLSKFSHEAGAAVLTDLHGLLRSFKSARGKQWSLEALQLACCLSGCDYHPRGIAGVGFHKAERLLTAHGPDVQTIVESLRRAGRTIAPDCLDKIRVALLAFRHQSVFVLQGKEHIKCAPLTEPPLPLDGYTQQMLGPLLTGSIAAGVCGGFLHPLKLSPLEFDKQTRVVEQFMSGSAELSLSRARLSSATVKGGGGLQTRKRKQRNMLANIGAKNFCMRSSRRINRWRVESEEEEGNAEGEGKEQVVQKGEEEEEEQEEEQEQEQEQEQVQEEASEELVSTLEKIRPRNQNRHKCSFNPLPEITCLPRTEGEGRHSAAAAFRGLEDQSSSSRCYTTRRKRTSFDPLRLQGLSACALKGRSSPCAEAQPFARNWNPSKEAEDAAFSLCACKMRLVLATPCICQAAPPRVQTQQRGVFTAGKGNGRKRKTKSPLSDADSKVRGQQTSKEDDSRDIEWQARRRGEFLVKSEQRQDERIEVELLQMQQGEGSVFAAAGQQLLQQRTERKAGKLRVIRHDSQQSLASLFLEGKPLTTAVINAG